MVVNKSEKKSGMDNYIQIRGEGLYSQPQRIENEIISPRGSDIPYLDVK